MSREVHVRFWERVRVKSPRATRLPLARQSHIYAREKVDLHRSTLTDWVGRSTALLEPLADHIGKLVRAGSALFADDTPVKLQTKTKTKKAKTARLWSYVRDERPWQGQAPPCVWYQFSVDRKGEHPVNHLSGYTGTVHADGYAGFNGLFGENKADEQACMVHVRRKFVDVYEAQGSAVAKEVIERIADLYAVEKEARGQSPEERGGLRQTKAKPIFDDLESWLQLQLPKISGKTSLGKQSVTPWAACQRREPTSVTVCWSSTTTFVSGPSAPLHLVAKITCSWAQLAAVKLRPPPTLSSRLQR